jgi:hypothetical protein
MSENVEKGFFIELLGIIKLVTIFAIRKINFQSCLFFMAFLTLGLGDGVTSAYMMEKLGARAEINPIMSLVFLENGFGGMVAVKIWLTLLLLFAVYVVGLRSNGRAFWTVNGFLIALTAGGILAMNANLSAIRGSVSSSPAEIIVMYLAMTFLLIEAGSYIDSQ